MRKSRCHGPQGLGEISKKGQWEEIECNSFTGRGCQMFFWSWLRKMYWTSIFQYIIGPRKQ